MIPWPEANLLRILHRDSVKEIENLSKEQLSRRFEPGSQTLLMLAAASGANAVIGFLRSTVPTLINARSDDGKTALMYACVIGHLTAVKLLVEASDVNAQDARGMTALMHLAWARPTDVIAIADVLLAAQARIDLRDADNQTALDWALRRHTTSGDVTAYWVGDEDELVERLR